MTLAGLPEHIARKIAVDPGTGCWRWTAAKNERGYGRIRWDGRVTKSHRVVYELLIGPVPDGLEIDHLCRVRDCCNPSHLEAVTHKVNLSRGNSPFAIHARKTHCPRGHAYDEANTAMNNGSRRCRACGRERARLKAFRRRMDAYLSKEKA